jgi:hypothetical protein
VTNIASLSRIYHATTDVSMQKEFRRLCCGAVTVSGNSFGDTNRFWRFSEDVEATVDAVMRAIPLLDRNVKSSKHAGGVMVGRTTVKFADPTPTNNVRSPVNACFSWTLATGAAMFGNDDVGDRRTTRLITPRCWASTTTIDLAKACSISLMPLEMDSERLDVAVPENLADVTVPVDVYVEESELDRDKL